MFRLHYSKSINKLILNSPSGAYLLKKWVSEIQQKSIGFQGTQNTLNDGTGVKGVGKRGPSKRKDQQGKFTRRRLQVKHQRNQQLIQLRSQKELSVVCINSQSNLAAIRLEKHSAPANPCKNKDDHKQNLVKRTDGLRGNNLRPSWFGRRQGQLSNSKKSAHENTPQKLSKNQPVLQSNRPDPTSSVNKLKGLKQSQISLKSFISRFGNPNNQYKPFSRNKLRCLTQYSQELCLNDADQNLSRFLRSKLRVSSPRDRRARQPIRMSTQGNYPQQ